MSGVGSLARRTFASAFVLATVGTTAGVAWAQEVTTPSEVTTTSILEEPTTITPPPTQPEKPPPTQPEQPPPTSVTTTPPSTEAPRPTTTQRPTTTTTQRSTTIPSSPQTTPTTHRPASRAPVIVFPTKADGAVPTSTTAPGAAVEPKIAVKTIPGVEGTTTTGPDRDARVAGRTEERGTGTGDLVARSIEDGSSSLLPSSTLGAVLFVALVGFLTGGAYCGWLLVFARR